MSKATVEILGRSYAVKKPPQFAVKEELIMAYGEARSSGHRNRVCAAVLGICSDLGRDAKADYVAARFDPLAYGGAVYGYLRQGGATQAQIVAEATPLIIELTDEIFPREAEVAARADFSGAPEAG